MKQVILLLNSNQEQWLIRFMGVAHQTAGDKKFVISGSSMSYPTDSTVNRTVTIMQILTIDQQSDYRHKCLKVSLLFIFVFMSCALSACVEMDFIDGPDSPMTLDESETRSLMHDLAVSISAIEDSGISDMDIDEQRSVIVSELEKIAALIGWLENDNLLEEQIRLEGSHEFVGKYLRSLALEVELAKEQVAKSDENFDFFVAGKLAGVCRGCHEKLWPD